MPSNSNAGSHTGKRRRIMRSLTIKEISGVDTPAQQGATVVIMKRHDPDDIPETFDKASAITSPEDGHSHLLMLNGPPDGVELNSGFTDYVDGHLHPWVRMNGGEIVLGIASGDSGVPHTHSIVSVGKVNDDDNQPGTVGKKENDDMTKDFNKADDVPTVEQVTKLQAQLNRANLVATLNDAMKAHLGTLEGDAADAFLTKSDKERQTVVDNLAKVAVDEDPVVYKTIDGIDLHKSAGEAFIAIAKSNDALRKDNDELREQREQDILVKRAETEFSHIPGDIGVRTTMLKALDGIKDDAQREAAMGALKAQNEAMSKAFDVIGHGGSPVPGSSDDQLEQLAKKYNGENPNLTPEQAFDAVLKTAAGSELYAKSVN